MSRLKLKQLRLLVAIADSRNILHAARTLNISQPSATKLLQDLEANFGAALFERTNRGVAPTASGEALLRHARLVLSQLGHAAQELDDLAEGKGGRIVVGTLLAASATLLPHAIREILLHRPNVSINVVEGTNARLMPMLQTGDLDLIVGRLPENRYREGVSQEVLYSEKVCVVARTGHDLMQVQRPTLDDLKDCDWILQPRDTTLRRQIEKEFHDAGCEVPRTTVESVSILTNLELLRTTEMITILPYGVIKDPVLRGDLAVVPVKLGIALGPVGVTYRRDSRLSPATIGFVEVLQRVAKSASPPQGEASNLI